MNFCQTLSHMGEAVEAVHYGIDRKQDMLYYCEKCYIHACFARGAHIVANGLRMPNEKERILLIAARLKGER